MTTAQESLQQSLTAEHPEPRDEEREAFRVTDIGGANWAMRKLAGVRRRQAVNSATAEAERAKVDAWERGVNEPLENDAAFFEAVLADYARRCYEESGDKTVKLIGGTVRSRAVTRWEFDDEAVLAWARRTNCTELIRVKQEVDKAAAKKALTIHPGTDELGRHPVHVEGEFVPGVAVTQARTYSVDVEVER